jgi:hypothetical protein
MLIALAALLASAQTAQPHNGPMLGHTAWLVATVGHSEFCPAGNLRLDLVTGRYQFTAGLLRSSICERARGDRPTRAGVLSGAQLVTVRAAFRRAVTEDVKSETCREGRLPDEVLVNNGGTPVLILTTGQFTLSAPDNLACWSDAANALHETLDRVFPSRPPR